MFMFGEPRVYPNKIVCYTVFFGHDKTVWDAVFALEASMVTQSSSLYLPIKSSNASRSKDASVRPVRLESFPSFSSMALG